MELKFNIVNPIASTGEMFCEPIFTDIAQDISFINEKGFFSKKKYRDIESCKQFDKKKNIIHNGHNIAISISTICWTNPNL